MQMENGFHGSCKVPASDEFDCFCSIQFLSSGSKYLVNERSSNRSEY